MVSNLNIQIVGGNQHNRRLRVNGYLEFFRVMYNMVTINKRYFKRILATKGRCHINLTDLNLTHS